MKAMKKAILYFAVLMGALCLALASCKKPEGEEIDDLFVNDSIEIFHLEAVGNVDYADFTISYALAKKTQLDKMELHWFEKPLDSLVPDTPEVPVDSTGTGDSIGGRASYQDVIRLLIEKPTTLEAGWEQHFRLFGLKPGTSYCYFLVVEDLLGRKTSDTLEFATKTIADATMFTRVTTDSVRLVESQPIFYGSVKTHWRALDAEKGFTLGIRYGMDSLHLDQTLTNAVIDIPASGVITEPDEGDRVLCVFHCAAPVMDSCWYQAFVKDSWGNEYVSDTMLQYSNALPQAIWAPFTGTSVVGVRVDGSTQVTFRGNSQYNGGDDLRMKKRGFCWAKHPEPTLMDSVWYDPNPLEWNRKFEYHLTGLESATKYYCKVFLVLDDADSTTFWSEGKEFITASGLAITLDEAFNITATTIDLKASVADTMFAVEDCGFLWRKVNGPNDPAIVTFDNIQQAGGMVPATLSDKLDFSATVSDLEPRQEYFFRAYMRLKNGEVGFSQVRRAETEGAPE